MADRQLQRLSTSSGSGPVLEPSRDQLALNGASAATTSTPKLVTPPVAAANDREQAARQQAQDWSRLASARDPMAAPRPPKIPAAVAQQAAALEADVVRHGGRVSDSIGLATMLLSIRNQLRVFPGSITSNNVYFVDMGLDNQEPRGYILDIAQNRVARGPFRAAAGRESGPMNGVPGDFTPGATRNTTELGLSIVYDIGRIDRHVGGRWVTAQGMYLRGVGTMNGGVDDGHKYVHAADEYITPTHTGRSEGCPSTMTADYVAIRDRVGKGGAVFIYSPKGGMRLAQITQQQDGGHTRSSIWPFR